MNETVNIANGGRRLRPAVDELEGSLIRKVAEMNIGRDDVVPLWFGEPDLPTPDYIKQALVQAVASCGMVHRSAHHGNPNRVPGC